MARAEEWSVKVRMPDSATASLLVSLLTRKGREAGRFGRRVTIVASTQEDAQALAAEMETAHPGVRVQVRGD